MTVNSEDNGGWLSGRIPAELAEEITKFHEFYTQAAVKRGWPRPRKQDTMERIVRAGVAAERERLSGDSA